MPTSRPGVLRPMTLADVPAVVAGQEPAAVLGLGDVFPQDLYPFPRADITTRWRGELADPAVGCYVIDVDGDIEGFAALRDDELLHLGITVDHWGTGLARAGLIRRTGGHVPRLERTGPPRHRCSSHASTTC